LFKELHALALKTEFAMHKMDLDQVEMKTESLDAQGKSAYFFNTVAGIN